jgi:hypothetical protein
MSKIKVISHEIVVNVPVSGAFYEILTKHMLKLLERQEDPKKAVANIASKENLTVDESLIKVLGMLIKSIEEQVGIEDKFSYRDLPEAD